MNDEKMQKIIALAIEKAEDAFRKGEIPVAAVIFHLETGEVIAAAANDNGKKSVATNHAEMLAIAAASEKVGNRYLSEYGIFVSRRSVKYKKASAILAASISEGLNTDSASLLVIRL